MSPNSVPVTAISAKNTSQAKRRFLVLLNTSSGRRQDGNLQELLAKYLEPFDYETLTVGEGIDERLSQRLREFSPERVIAAGGDGTINLAAKHLLNNPIELGIVPTGSANGMARELGLPLNVEDALQIAVGGNVWPIDVLCINGDHFCLHLSDVGLNAKVVKRFQENSNRGMWGYVVQFLRELWSTYTSRFTFKLPNGESFKAHAHMVIAANASRYGTGAVVNPDAVLDDGKFELCIIKRMPFRGMIRLAFSIWLGNVKHHPWTTVTSYEEITIINEGNRMVQTDGEVLGRLPKVHVKALKQALRVVVG
ncbi:diacylglycerol kinase family lipid kinase [soil metagenome]